jgi:small multidrug resistance pump
MLPYYLALFGAIAVSAGGQVLLKTGSLGEGDFIVQLFRFSTLAGLACYGLSAALFIFALRKIPLAVAGPTAALTYVCAALAGWLIFEERLAAMQIAGIGLIIVGVGLLTRA